MDGVHWGADDFRSWVRDGVRVLAQHEQRLNEINVFPEPDADTGTNLLQLWRTVAAAELTGDELGDVAAKAAKAAIAGASGSSATVVAAVLLTAFAKTWRGHTHIDHATFVSGLRAAAVRARAVYPNPRDGTIITVLDEVRDAAEQVPVAAGWARLFTVMVDAARRAVAETTERVPALRAAGVVDAGGMGLLLLLEQLHAPQ